MFLVNNSTHACPHTQACTCIDAHTAMVKCLAPQLERMEENIWDTWKGKSTFVN